MLVDQLKIQRFRGISDTLSLDLSSPLTLIYAPNGTGKTSICDAVEWLLCGGIGRLSSLDKNDVRCRFGDNDLETAIEATIPHNDNPFSIKRVLSDAGTTLFWKDQNSDYTKANDQELLRRFVTALPPTGNSNRAKIDWVRSTRFLESDSLSLLIDSDRESNDTRKLIFSNLFGVAEYQKAESNLNKILNKLPAASTIVREKKKIRAKITEYKDSIKKITAEQTEPYHDHISSLLDSIAKHLDEKKDEYDNLQEYHKHLEISFIQNNESLNEQKSALLYIKENLNTYTENTSRSEELTKNIKAGDDTLKTLTESYNKKKQELETKQNTAARQEKLLIEIAETMQELKTEKTVCKQLYQSYLAPSLDIGEHENRADKIAEYVVSAEQKAFSLQEKITLVEECIEQLPSWIKKRERIKGINIEIEALESRKPKANEEKPLVERISEIKAQINTLQASREKTLGELELLLSSGKRYVELHTEDTECPLCAHPYESNQVLQEKINTRFSRLSEKSKEEATLASRHEELTKQLHHENQLLTQSQELTNQKVQLLGDLQEVESVFIQAGLAKEALSKAEDVAEKFEDIRKQHQSELKVTTDNLSPYKSAHEAVKRLEEKLIRIEFLISTWHEKLGKDGLKPLNIDDLDKAITELELLLEDQAKPQKKLQEERKSAIVKLSQELKELEDNKNKKSAENSALKEKLNTITNALKDFTRKWAVISNARHVDNLEIEKSASAIDKKNRSINEAKLLFEKTEEYFTKIREHEKKESECKLHQKEIQSAKEELQEWINQEDARKVIEKEINSIQEEIRRFISKEIAPLSSIISTLYLRAQGNRFISSIAAEPTKDGLLNWIAELDENGEAFDKMQALSQGQRQDLALAIFLARARSLGGTFFMDEPLAHLDDLNRVALLDMLRIIVSEKDTPVPLRLVLTTASNNLLRHLREKFSLVDDREGNPALRIYKMNGNPKVGLDIEVPELVHSPNRLLTA